MSAAEACDAVLRENLFGLELDPRCTQIAAFALALAAWRYPHEDGLPLGYRELPPLNIAACGLAPNAGLGEWLRVAERAAAAGGLPVQCDLFGAEQNLLSSRVRAGLEELYRRFQQGPTLGSLLDPAAVGGDLLAADFGQLQPLFKLRKRLLETMSWNVVARLGPRAFETISGEVVNVALLTLTCQPPSDEQALAGLDVAEEKNPLKKAQACLSKDLSVAVQKCQLGNPDYLVTLDPCDSRQLLRVFATSYRGQCTGDSPRFELRFWEVSRMLGWAFLQSAPQELRAYTGRESVVLWEEGRGTLKRIADELRAIPGHNGIRPTRGDDAWGTWATGSAPRPTTLERASPVPTCVWRPPRPCRKSSS